jgi:hypothetical protein
MIKLTETRDHALRLGASGRGAIRTSINSHRLAAQRAIIKSAVRCHRSTIVIEGNETYEEAALTKRCYPKRIAIVDNGDGKQLNLAGQYVGADVFG